MQTEKQALNYHTKLRSNVKVFRNPVNGDYASESTLTTGEIRLLAFQDVVVSVQRFLEGL